MIKADAKLSIRKIGLGEILLDEFQERYPDRLAHYMRLLKEHPGSYAGFVSVVPSKSYPGLWVLLDGHHRLMASLMVGRRDLLAVVIEEDES